MVSVKKKVSKGEGDESENWIVYMYVVDDMLN